LFTVGNLVPDIYN